MAKQSEEREAELDKVVVLADMYYNTPDIVKLPGIAAEVAKHSNFTKEEVLKHLKKRLFESLDLVNGKQSKDIGFG